jgi:hypothetical protein
MVIRTLRGKFGRHPNVRRQRGRAEDGAFTRLMDGVRFANGLVRARDGTSLIVAESAGSRLLRLWFAGNRAGTSEVVAELPGFPDNLGCDDDGIVWVAFASEPNPARDRIHKLPLFQRRLARACRRAGSCRSKEYGPIAAVARRATEGYTGSIYSPYAVKR